jgi:hypothetical protein
MYSFQGSREQRAECGHPGQVHREHHPTARDSGKPIFENHATSSSKKSRNLSNEENHATSSSVDNWTCSGAVCLR